MLICTTGYISYLLFLKYICKVKSVRSSHDSTLCFHLLYKDKQVTLHLKFKIGLHRTGLGEAKAQHGLSGQPRTRRTLRSGIYSALTILGHRRPPKVGLYGTRYIISRFLSPRWKKRNQIKHPQLSQEDVHFYLQSVLFH